MRTGPTPGTMLIGSGGVAERWRVPIGMVPFAGGGVVVGGVLVGGVEGASGRTHCAYCVDMINLCAPLPSPPRAREERPTPTLSGLLRPVSCLSGQ